MEKELRILEAIAEKPTYSQREISKSSGLSLGTVNLVLEKLIRDGIVKIERIPAHRVMYMLTPKGFQEKLNKTKTYLELYYKIFDREKERVKARILSAYAGEKFDLAIQDPAMLRLVRQAIIELNLTQTADTILVVADTASKDSIESGHKMILIDCEGCE